MTYYFHEVPGRLRIKIPALRRNSVLAADIQDSLNSLSGIKSTSANIVTGSIIVHYDPDRLSSSGILSLLSHEQYIDMDKGVPNHQRVDQALDAAGRAASKALLGFALDRALSGSPFAILTAFI
jgi:hypothetical protein